MAKPKMNIDHFCIDDVLDHYEERDNKRLKKQEKKKGTEKLEVEITLG